MSLGDAVRKLRDQRNWKQSELARRSKLTQGMITKIERGTTPNPTQTTIIKLAYGLGITVDDLLREAGMSSILPSDSVAGNLPPVLAAALREHGPYLDEAAWQQVKGYMARLAEERVSDPRPESTT